jgi:hypothetical protein
MALKCYPIMSHRGILYLADKYAQLLSTDPMVMQKRENFAYDLRMKLNIISAEMENEIHHLREKGFDKGQQEQFINLWRELVDVKKQMNMSQPYETATQIIGYISDYQRQDLMKKLESSAKKVYPDMKSFGLLNKLLEHLEKYLDENPWYSN